MAEKSKLVEFVILDKKLIVPGLLHGLAGKGGELVLPKNFGIRVVPSGQIIAYSETPTFKMNYATQVKKVKEKKEVEVEELEITGESNIFDEL